MCKKNYFFILFVVVLLSNITLSATSFETSGTISSNTTWTGVDTVKVTGDITVNNGITLTIDPGIYVEFQGHYKLEVDGQLLAIGTSYHMITFTAANHSTGWNRIVFNYTPTTNDSSKIVYCQLEYGKAIYGNKGGAIYIRSFEKLLVSNCFLSNNYAEYDGGAIHCRYADIKISNCTLENNDADDSGGALCCRYSNIEIKYCDLNNNSAGFGGGIYIYDCEPVLINNIIRNNSASNSGGIYFNNSNATLINNTIVNNSNKGIYCNNDSDPSFRNTIIYGNSGNEVSLNSDNDDPNFYFCDIEGGTGAFGGAGSGANFTGNYENCIDANPQFIVSGDHPYDLSNSSPCINAGDPATTFNDAGEYDLSGEPRIQQGRIDIGAYETSENPDDFPGYVLEFDGIDNYVSINPLWETSPSEFTCEAWIYPTAGGDEVILFHGDNGEFMLGIGNNDLYFKIHLTNENWYEVSMPAIPWNEWHHIAGVWKKNNYLKLYVNGELIDSEIVHDYFLKDPGAGFSNCFGSYNQTGGYFNGKIDEFTFWNTERNIDEIRENMHLTFNGTETGLINYWQFNEGTGIYCNELISGNYGTLQNMDSDDWIESTVPVGGGVSDTQTEIAGTVDFTGTDLSMFFNSVGVAEITVSRIDILANINPTEPDEVFDAQYWFVNRYGTGIFGADLTFTLSEDLTASDESNSNQIALFTRSSTADTDWVYLMSASSVNAVNNEATFDGITDFSQFIIGRWQQSLDIPQNVTIEIIGTDVQISWDSVTGANSYKIYADDDPYADDWGDAVASVSGTTWSETIVDEMKFYYVVASTDEAREMINSKKSQKTKYPKTNFKKSDIPTKKMKISKVKIDH